MIRELVEKALYIKRLTPDLENAINSELTLLGYIDDADYEALELLMSEMDAGRIELVASCWSIYLTYLTLTEILDSFLKLHNCSEEKK